MIQTCGCLAITSASARNSSREQDAPVGLFGLFSTSSFVRGVIAASISSGRGLKPLFCGHGTSTGSASMNRVISV